VKLYKHINNKDVAVEILKFMRIPGKDYARIKVKWWNIGPHKSYDMLIQSWLLDATKTGNVRNRGKYPLSKWESEWKLYTS